MSDPKRMIPYGRQTLDEDDIQAVVQVLRSDFLTQGPVVERFEKALAAYAGARHAVVFANGTLALLAAYEAAGLTSGKTFVTSPMTFAATVNAGFWLGAAPQWADINLQDGNITVDSIDVAARGSSPHAVISVDFAGRPADYDGIRAWCRERGAVFISDACHSLGATYLGKRIGALADLTVFSFHPVKSITTGEGGAVLTYDDAWAEQLRRFRQHGVTKTSDYYEVDSLGINGRLTDMQCALGHSQLRKLDSFIQARRERAEKYTRRLKQMDSIALPLEDDMKVSAWHLYVIRLKNAEKRRWAIVRELRKRGVGAQVHYRALNQHPYYRSRGFADDCPKAREFGESVISLPLYPALTIEDQEYVMKTLEAVLVEHYASAHAS